MSQNDDPFESPKYLASWAKAKAADFKSRADGFVQTGPYEEFVEIDPERGKKVFKMRLSQSIPGELRGIGTDALNTLRNALDQSVFAASKWLSEKRVRNTHFPFGESPADLDDALTRTKGPYSDIPIELHPKLRAFEPHPTGDGYSGGNDLLRALGRVSGPNKHQVALTIGVAPTAFEMCYCTTGCGINQVAWDRTKNEMELFFVPLDANPDYKYMVWTFIAFAEGGHLEQWNAGDALTVLAETVESIVHALEAEAYRLKPRSGVSHSPLPPPWVREV